MLYHDQGSKRKWYTDSVKDEDYVNRIKRAEEREEHLQKLKENEKQKLKDMVEIQEFENSI